MSALADSRGDDYETEVARAWVSRLETEVDRLYAEVDRLRADNGRLRAEIEGLRRDNRALIREHLDADLLESKP
jgi:cell division protein FtsB